MTKSQGVHIDDKLYNLVFDHETYVVSDVPAHPDSDARMERRVNHSSWKQGILKRRDVDQAADSNIYSLSLYNRIEKVGNGLYMSWGGDTRMGDRIFGQRATGTTQAVASAPVLMGDGSLNSWIACKQHFYLLSGVSGGVQQVVLSKDFSSISPFVNVVDVASFNGRVYVATAQLTNGIPDPAKPQVMWVWDQTSATTNWTNPPTPLNTPTFAAAVQTNLSASLAASGAATASVSSTTGLPANPTQFTTLIDSELITFTVNNSTTLNVIARGVQNTSAAVHNTGAAVLYNPAVSVVGNAGTTRYQYQIIAVGSNADSLPSQIQVINYGPATLTGSNYNVINWNAVSGATSYKINRVYSGGTPSTVGIIATGVGATTYNDTGAAPLANQYQVTPQFPIGDTGQAIAFAVIRNNLWRAAGSKMWSWDGQQATWSGESVIGDPTTNITALDVFKDGLVIFKQDGIYTLDRGGNVFPLFPGFRTLGLNPRPLGQWQGSYYFASDAGMIWKWNGTDVTSIGFDFAEAYPFPDGTYGLFNAVTRGLSLPNFFLVGFNKWNDTTHNSCFYLAWDDNGWHPFHFDANYQASGLGFTGGNQTPVNPTIQFGKVTANGSSYSVSYMTNPTIDPLLATSYDLTPQTYILPVDSGIIEDEWKVFEGVRVYIDNAASGTVRISYAVDENIYNLTFQDLGVPRGDLTSTQLFIPADPVPYRKIFFKVVVSPKASTGTPIIRSVVHRYKQRESQRKSWKVVLFLEEGQMNANRQKESRSSQKMLFDLNSARKNRKLVTFIDLVGDSYQVYVEQVEESVKRYSPSVNGGNATFLCTVVMVEPVEMDLSA